MYRYVQTSTLAVLLVLLCHETWGKPTIAAADCKNSYSLTCLKLDMVSWVDKMSEESKYKILPGVSLVREPSNDTLSTAEIVGEIAREFPDDPESRLNAFLTRKVQGYFNSHSVRINLLEEVSSQDNEVAEGRKYKYKDKNGFGAALMAGALMKGMLFAMAFKALTFMAGSAMFGSFLSLIISLMAGVKSLSSGGHKSTTYEIISKPIHYGGDGGDGHAYRRSYDTSAGVAAGHRIVL